MAARWMMFVTAAAIAVAGSGCIVVAGGAQRNPYQTCGSADTCTGGSSCQSANRTTDGFVGTFCTSTCNTAASPPSCPADPGGAPLVCVPNADGTTAGQCYIACNGTACPYGFTCATEGGVLYCVP